MYESGPREVIISHAIGTSTTVIGADGFGDWVIWNPWRDTTAQLADMEPKDYLHMLCVEAARITQPVTLQPAALDGNGSHRRHLTSESQFRSRLTALWTTRGHESGTARPMLSNPLPQRAMRLSIALTAAVLLAACSRQNKPPLGADTTVIKPNSNLPATATAPIPKNGSDTIAVPAGAVDTTTNRAAGTSPQGANANGKAVGVDTPITRRMGSPAKAKP